MAPSSYVPGSRLEHRGDLALLQTAVDLWKPEKEDEEPMGCERGCLVLELQFYPTKVCGLSSSRQITAMLPDTGPGLRIVYTLATNYDLKYGEDLQEPYDKLVAAVERVFGDSKSVVWWLEFELNSDPRTRPAVGDSPS